MTDRTKITVHPFADSTVLITGGTSGVGLASAKLFASRGVRKIALVGRNAERGEQARRAVLEVSPQANVAFVAADANQLDQAVNAAEQVRKQFGSVDILVNSTIGLYTPNPLQDIPLEDIQPIILQTVLAPMLMSRIVLPWMRERGGGCIINMASDAAKVPTPGETILDAAMSAIVLFSRTLSMEAKRFGVRVNVLTPSLITGTPTAERVQKEGFSAKLFATVAKLADLGVVEPHEVAELIVFLASPQAAKITGQTVSINGGISAG